jgi:hypothetical protein
VDIGEWSVVDIDLSPCPYLVDIGRSQLQIAWEQQDLQQPNQKNPQLIALEASYLLAVFPLVHPVLPHQMVNLPKQRASWIAC